MAQTSKAKAPATTSDDGKQPFKTTSPDFQHLQKIMEQPGFDVAYPGPMKFYDHPNNTFFSEKYKRDGFNNAFYKAKAKANAAIAGVAVTAANDDDGECFWSSFCW